MAAGFYLSGVCYPSVSNAWDAFSGSYPKFDAGYFWSLQGSPTFLSDGFQFSSKRSGSLFTVTNTVKLPSCNTENLNLSSADFYLVILASCVLFALGFGAAK